MRTTGQELALRAREAAERWRNAVRLASRRGNMADLHEALRDRRLNAPSPVAIPYDEVFERLICRR